MRYSYLGGGIALWIVQLAEKEACLSLPVRGPNADWRHADLWHNPDAPGRLQAGLLMVETPTFRPHAPRSLSSNAMIRSPGGIPFSRR